MSLSWIAFVKLLKRGRRVTRCFFKHIAKSRQAFISHINTNLMRIDPLFEELFASVNPKISQKLSWRDSINALEHSDKMVAGHKCA